MTGTDYKSVEEFEYGRDSKTQNTRSMQPPRMHVPRGSDTPRVKAAKPAGRTVNTVNTQGQGT